MYRHTNEVYNETFIKVMDLIQQCTARRLPAEATIARQLGVSRVTVRDVLGEMETKGYVSRRRGVGTVINRHILEHTARLDIDNFYEDMIRKSGFEPSCDIKKLRVLQEQAPSVRKGLGLEEGEKVYQIQKVLRANGRPVMCVNDYIAERYYDRDNIDIPLIQKSTFFFVQKYCDELLDTSISHVDTCLAEGDIAADMQVEEGTPLLYLESVVYSVKQQPLVYTIEYINTKVMTFSIQKRLTRHNYTDIRLANL